MFDPIVPPPTEHHPLNTGHSTEFGDNAKTAFEKINAGFKHVYGVLKGMGATLADEVEYVAKTEFDAVVHELGEVQAELRNVKMMVQGLGFAGTVTDPSHSMTITDPDPLATAQAIVAAGPGPLVTVTAPEAAGVSFASMTGGTVTGEPIVTVKEVPQS